MKKVVAELEDGVDTVASSYRVLVGVVTWIRSLTPEFTVAFY